MSKLTKQQALDKIEELKKYVDSVDKKETKTVGIAIKNRWTGSIIFQSTKTTIKEAVREALDCDSDLSGSDLSGSDLRGSDLRGSNLSGSNLSGSDLRGSDLRGSNLSGSNLSDSDLRGSDLSGSDLSGAELDSAKFYGKGGNKPLRRSQLPDFLAALGFVIED